jgi:2-iminobutanoate/2-iminopropanoate deaminase
VIDAFNTSGIWAPFGAFSMGVIAGGGQIVYLKGQVALDRDGAVVGKGDMRAQTRQVLENIAAVLGDKTAPPPPPTSSRLPSTPPTSRLS